MNDYIKGKYRRSIFTSEKGYVIGLFKVTETNIEEMQEYVNQVVTFTGYFYDLNDNDTYQMYGTWIMHPRYGYQFQVDSYERVKPTDQEAIIEFLSSDLFPGVGESLAKRIVETLGDKTLDLIIEDPSCLNLVPKLTKTKADKIKRILKEYNESSQIIVDLTNLGFKMKDAINIYNTYEKQTLIKINENIYNIIDDVNDITFSKVDIAAFNMDIEKSDKRRITAAIIYIMKKLIYQNGDTFLKKTQIINAVNKFLNLDIEIDYDKLFNNLKNKEKIIIDHDNYYLKEIWDAEENITSKIYKLKTTPMKTYSQLPDMITELEKVNNITYNDLQKEAISKALQSRFLIITGGPGTGKTTIIRAITELYSIINNKNEDELIQDLALLAPTGRASKRMSEATNLPASTIHRFLKWNKDTGEFMINENNKAKCKLIIIDEVSMIDIILFDNLLKGLNDNVQIILVGDYNQLPSVGPGQVLKDLINSNCIDVVELEELYRQSEDSYIINLAHEVKEGKLTDNFLHQYKDYTFLKCSSNYIKKNLHNLCKQVIDKGYDYKRVQILAPMYKGENGIDLLNKELQEVFNPKDINKREYVVGDITYRENDKILQLENMPDENVYNGDIGIIKYIKNSKDGKKEIFVDFDGNLVKYSSKDLIKIKHGFIISIHKSQGSEFEMVIMPICNSYHRMLYKKLVYTAITRAKKKLIIVGEPQAFINSVHNNNEYIRNSELLKKIQYKFEIGG